MTKYTVYKAVSESEGGVYIRTTTSPLSEIDGTVEHIADVEGDEQTAQIAVCWCLLKMEEENKCNGRDYRHGILNHGDLQEFDYIMKATVGLGRLEFPTLTQKAVDWITKRYAINCANDPIMSKKRPAGKSNQRAKCGLCGFECLHKNMKKHTGNSRCKTRQAQNQLLTDDQREEAKRARKRAQLEKQNVKVTCPTCGAAVLKRHLKRHQEGGRCKKPNAAVAAEE